MKTKQKKTKTRNKFETRISKELIACGVNVKYESEKIPYLIAGHYIPDFVIKTKTGKIYIETKGHFRPEAKRKMVAVRKLNPTLDIRILFYKHSKANEKWCAKHGFHYAFDTIPESWLDALH